MKTKKTLIPFIAAALLAAPSANAEFVIIARDTVDAVGNYTYSGNLLSSGATSANGGVGNGAYVRFSRNTGSAKTTHGVFNAGFGASITVAAGTYRLSAHSAKLSDRVPWTTFDVKLMTNTGVAWESLAVDPISKTVTIPYVAGTTAVTWAKTEVEYVIPTGHALIGEEFTWGFTGGKPAGAYFVGFDLAEVQFIPDGGGPGPTGYAAWATGDEPFGDDANGDGVSNGMAFLLGASGPNVSALGLLPTVSESAGNLVLTFSMLNSDNRGTAALSVEHSSDLVIGDDWTTVLVPDANGGPTSGVTFLVTPGSPLNSVEATIGSAEAGGTGKLFGRLKATE